MKVGTLSKYRVSLATIFTSNIRRILCFPLKQFLPICPSPIFFTNWQWNTNSRTTAPFPHRVVEVDREVGSHLCGVLKSGGPVCSDQNMLEGLPCLSVQLHFFGPGRNLYLLEVLFYLVVKPVGAICLVCSLCKCSMKNTGNRFSMEIYDVWIPALKLKIQARHLTFLLSSLIICLKGINARCPKYVPGWLWGSKEVFYIEMLCKL